jgi:hypothetical protein
MRVCIVFEKKINMAIVRILSPKEVKNQYLEDRYGLDDFNSIKNIMNKQEEAIERDKIFRDMYYSIFPFPSPFQSPPQIRNFNEEDLEYAKRYYKFKLAGFLHGMGPYETNIYYKYTIAFELDSKSYWEKMFKFHEKIKNDTILDSLPYARKHPEMYLFYPASKLPYLYHNMRSIVDHMLGYECKSSQPSITPDVREFIERYFT